MGLFGLSLTSTVRFLQEDNHALTKRNADLQADREDDARTIRAQRGTLDMIQTVSNKREQKLKDAAIFLHGFKRKLTEYRSAGKIGPTQRKELNADMDKTLEQLRQTLENPIEPAPTATPKK